MSGIASFILAIFQAVRKHPYTEKAFWATGVICLLFAFDQAWQDEHRNTQVVIAEKALEAGAKDMCISNSRVQDAYAKGLEGSNLNERQTIDALRQDSDNQQRTVNRCVIDLGRMNPRLTNKVEAYYMLLAGDGRTGVYAMLITTNHPERPAGRLHCDGSFEPMEAPEIHVFGTGTVAMVANQGPIKISDKEYDLQVVNTAAVWGPNTPIFFKFKTLDGTHLGGCHFTPQ